jgi:cysteine-rich repeat protein
LMSRKPFIRMVVLSCIAVITACDGGSPTESPGNTEVNLLISDPNMPPDELAFSIDFVSYQIFCEASGLTPYDDSVVVNGNFEIVDGANPPVWELVTDLPPADCTITLWVFHDDEVVCSGKQTMIIVEDGDPSTTNKYNITLECNLSTNTPSADVDIDGDFEFINGNYCPKMNWLGAMPMVVEAAVPPVTTIESSGFDLDSTCGLNCDPQLCDFTLNPPQCFAAPDPGFSIAFYAPAGKGSFNPNPPVLTGTPMTGGTPIEGQVTYTCDPLYPGPTEICAMASDGDNDCDSMRCATIVCPDLCEGVVCDDGNECTRDLCDPLTGLCSNDPAPDGIACSDCSATCVSGACSGPDWTAAVTFNGTTTMTGTVQPFNATLVNPYSGFSVSVNDTRRVNDSSYEGIGTNDILVGTNQGDILLIEDPVGVQRICGVEQILGQNNFDVLFLADDFIVLGDTMIEGGNEGDTLWGNAGDDTIVGNNGIDIIDGGPGNDFIDAGNGNDIITLWPGSGFDSILGGIGTIDTVQIDAEQNQITISPAVDLSYELDIFYLGTPMAQIMEVELVVLNDASVDLTACTGGPTDVCNLCGNDALNGGEGCDDGNNVDGDGCSSTCVAEY